jgi:hypothetical protein
MTIAALRFTETARAKIVKAGGKCLTLDQLIMATPTGKYWFLFFLFAINIYCSVKFINLLIELT